LLVCGGTLITLIRTNSPRELIKQDQQKTTRSTKNNKINKKQQNQQKTTKSTKNYKILKKNNFSEAIISARRAASFLASRHTNYANWH